MASEDFDPKYQSLNQIGVWNLHDSTLHQTGNSTQPSASTTSHSLPQQQYVRIYGDRSGNTWRMAKASDGQTYYYNVNTRETMWDLPEGAAALDIPVNHFKVSHAAHKHVRVSSDYGYGREEDDESTPRQKGVVKSTPILGTSWVKHELEDGRVYYSRPPNETSWEVPREVAAIMNNSDTAGEPQTSTDPELKLSKKKAVSAEPVPGTAWYVVLSGEGKCFYYSHMDRKSTWERPNELESNVLVDSILEKFEEQKKILLLANQHQETGTTFREAVYSRLGLSADTVSYFNPSDDVSAEKMFKTDMEAVQLPDGDAPKHSLEERMAAFNELLDENKVSAFSTYESEVSRLKDDPRFKLFSKKERKHLFNEFVKTRVEEEKKEKHRQIQQRYDTFNEFLKSVVKSAKMSYSDLLIRHWSDPRFKSVPKERERVEMFQNYVHQLNQRLTKEAEEALVSNNRLKSEYCAMLAENDRVDSHTPWRRVRKWVSNDPRYVAVDDEGLREKWFDEYIERKVETQKAKDLERMQEERQKASIRERERRVQTERKQFEERTLRERRAYLKEAATNEFQSLLSEVVSNPDISWREAKRLLQRDPRWKNVELQLSRDDYLALFDHHLSSLYKKIRDAFHELLRQVGVRQDSAWAQVYSQISLDPRCVKFSTNERSCKNEFYNYLESSYSKSKSDLLALLSETKMADHRFVAKAKLIPSLRDELDQVLQKDSRYTELDFAPDERRKIVDNYLEEVEKKGAPPPPTANKSK